MAIQLYEALDSAAPFFLTDDCSPPDEMYGRFDIKDKPYAVSIIRTNAKGLYEVSCGRVSNKNVGYWRFHSKGDLVPVLSTIIAFAKGFMNSNYNDGAIAFYIPFPNAIANNSNIKRIEKVASRIIRAKFSDLEVIPVEQPKNVKKNQVRSLFIAKKGVDYRKALTGAKFGAYDFEASSSTVLEDELAIVTPVKQAKSIVNDSPSTKYSFAGYSIDIENIDKAYLSTFNDLEGIASSNSNINFLKSKNPKNYYAVLGYFMYWMDRLRIKGKPETMFQDIEKAIRTLSSGNRIIYEIELILSEADLSFKILSNPKNSDISDDLYKSLMSDASFTRPEVKLGYEKMKATTELFNNSNTVYEIASLNETINPIMQFVYIAKKVNPNAYNRNISIFAQSTSKADDLIPGYNLNAPFSTTEINLIVKELQNVIRFKKHKILEAKKNEYSLKIFGKEAIPFLTDSHYTILNAVMTVAAQSVGLDSEYANGRMIKNILTSFKDLAKFNYNVLGPSVNLVNLDMSDYEKALEWRKNLLNGMLDRREFKTYEKLVKMYSERLKIDIILANPSTTSAGTITSRTAKALLSDLKSDIKGAGQLNTSNILNVYGDFNVKDFDSYEVAKYFRSDYENFISEVLSDPGHEHHGVFKSVKKYTSNSYKSINKPLRTLIKNIMLGKSDPGKLTKTHKDIIKAFDILPPVNSGFYVWRDAKVPEDIWNDMKPGKSYVDGGIISATLDKDFKFSGEANTRFMIWIPKGSRVIPILTNSHHESENEVILRPMSVVKIISIKESYNKKMVVGTYVGTAIKSVMKTHLLESTAIPDYCIDNEFKPLGYFLR